MRSFPRPRRRAAATLAVGSMLLGVAAFPPATADDLRDREDRVQRQLGAAHDDLDESSARLRRATAKLLAARGALSDARAELATTRGQLAAARVLDRQMQARLAAAEARLAAARAELDRGRADEAAQEELLRSVVVEGYQSGSAELMGLDAVFSADDPAEVTGRLNSAETVAGKQDAVLDSLRATTVLLTIHADEIRAARAEVAERRREAAANLARREALERQAEETRARVADLVQARRGAERVAERAKQHDLRQLRQLERERDRIAALIRAQASHTERRSPASGGGYLSAPLNAPVTSPYGWRIHPIYGYRSFHDGIDFGAACGTPIRAAAAGTVVQEYFQTAYGNRLVIDHGVQRGVGLATISNHLSGYAVSTGQRVARGQVIGYVGTTGWSTGCHLHFSVLENGGYVDPTKWL